MQGEKCYGKKLECNWEIQMKDYLGEAEEERKLTLNRKIKAILLKWIFPGTEVPKQS